ncbi:EamA family transporter [Patescibacteria group bacterium]
MNYIIYAFIAAICFAIAQIISKLLSKHSIDNKDSMMAYFMISTFSFSIVLVPFVPLTIPTTEVLSLMTAAVLTFLIGYYAFFTGVFKSDASSFAPLFQIQAGLIGLFAFIFLGERFPIQNYLLMVIIVLGAILVSIDEKMTPKSFLNKGILLIILMQVFHAISNLFVGFTLKQITPIQYLFWMNILIGIFSLLFIVIKKPKMNYKPVIVAPMFVSSYIVGVGIISLFTAYTQNLTISSVIGLLSAPIVFIVSIIASKFSPKFLEHHSTKIYVIRGIGLIIILLAAYKITVN